MNKSLTLLACGLFCQLTLAFHAAAQPTGLENLVSNPGFEQTTEPWVEDNWAHNEVAFTRTRESPHSGSYCMKVQLNKVIGTPSVAFNYPHLAVKPNMAIRVSYWARGVSNGAILTFNVRQGAAPWTRYFAAESGLIDDWQEYIYTFVLPGDADPANTQLLFGLREKGVFWLDDVSVTELPAVEGGPAPTANPIRNPSFEAGIDGWTASFRALEFGTMREESGGNYPSPEGAKLEAPEDAHSPHGRRVLSVEVKPQSRANVTSGYFPARYGHKLLLNFSLRADAARKFSAGLSSGKNANASVDLRPQDATDQWKKFSIPFTLKPSLGGVYCTEFQFNEPGKYQLDAVSLTEADQPSETLYPAAVAIEPVAGAPVAHLYAPGELAGFRLLVAGEKGRGSLAYEVTAFDYLGRPVSRSPLTITTDAEGYGSATFQVPTDKLGAFRMEARPAAKNGPLLAEQMYCVLPPLPPPAERPDSFFGGHLDLTSYNLEIGRRAGYRWLRLYPPLCTQWMVVEPDPGVWKFRTENVVHAKSLGFRILGNLGTAPEFAVKVDPKNPLKTRWTRPYPPANLDDWKEYITRTFNAFYDCVDAWEIWNEPDGGYMQVWPGVSKSDVYVDLLRTARESMQATGKPFLLMGPAGSNIHTDLASQVLDKGGAALLDAFSFHYYSMAAGGNNPDDAFATAQLKKYETYKNHAGDTMPLWHTEGGIFLSGSQSWLQTYRIPPSSAVTPPQAAASMVRASMLFKSSGVKHYFDYQVGTSEAGRKVHEDITCGFIDVTGIPGPGIAAHAAMVGITEDADPAGFEARMQGDVPVKIAHFKGKSGTVDVCWAGASIPLAKVVPAGFKGEMRDMMGNTVALEGTQLGEYPIYLIETAAK